MDIITFNEEIHSEEKDTSQIRLWTISQLCNGMRYAQYF